MLVSQAFRSAGVSPANLRSVAALEKIAGETPALRLPQKAPLAVGATSL
jgi:hypothetical protein